MGGEDITIGDLLASSTLEQMKLNIPDYIEENFKDYLERCEDNTEDYQKLLLDIKALPDILKKAGAI